MGLAACVQLTASLHDEYVQRTIPYVLSIFAFPDPQRVSASIAVHGDTVLQPYWHVFWAITYQHLFE